MDGINIFYEFNGNKRNIFCENVKDNLDLYKQISKKENLPLDLFKLFLNGKCLGQDQTLLEKKNDLFLNVALPLIGGKGGFGSMLRAIGAQIEKTTNKEACRDLSGRRLRDVNAEKRIKNWIKKKAEHQKELERKRREKLERLTQQPKIDFKDDEYLKEKDIIPQKVDEAIDYVLKNKKTSKKEVSNTIISVKADKKIDESNQPSTSSSDNEVSLNGHSNGNSDSQTDSDLSDSLEKKIKKPILKRKQDEPVIVSKKKKVELWLGEDLDSEEDSSEE